MNFNLEQDKRYVMGILNVTPDSFFDGGKYATLDKVMIRVDEMIAEGVDIIDIGGESSRPGSDRISIQEELDRILPVVSKIRDNYDIPISIDSMKSDVVEELLPFNIDLNK
jgi:dihydropteroate synthase